MSCLNFCIGIKVLIWFFIGLETCQIHGQMPERDAGGEPKKVPFAKLFEKTSHDFGTVARNAKTEHVFRFKNTTGQTIRLAAAAGSSNCAKFTILKKDVKPGETGGILCQFDSRSFLGKRKGTLSATFVKPHFGGVTLDFHAYVRRDIVVHPPSLDFREVSKSKGGTAKVRIEYAGKNDWKIEKASPSNPDIEIELKQTHRGNGLVGYELIAKLRPMVATGKLKNYRIMIKTNDKRLNEFPISVSGNVTRAVPKKGKESK